MSDNEERRSHWEQQNQLVLSRIDDLRLTADSALKGVHEIKEILAGNHVQSNNQQAQINELKSRFDKVQGWVMGIAAAIFIFVIQQIFQMMLHYQATQAVINKTQ